MCKNKILVVSYVIVIAYIIKTIIWLMTNVE